MIAETEKQLTDEAQALKEALAKQDKLKQKFDILYKKSIKNKYL